MKENDFWVEVFSPCSVGRLGYTIMSAILILMLSWDLAAVCATIYGVYASKFLLLPALFLLILPGTEVSIVGLTYMRPYW